MPSVKLARHIIEAFHELGYCQSNGMGEAPLSFTEIESYARITGAVNSKECMILRQMSKAYLATKNGAKDVLYVPPWQKEMNG